MEIDSGKDELANGKAYVDLAWSGDALYAMDEADNLGYFLPEEGSNVWFDGWVVPKNSQNKRAAHAFINFMNDPVHAAKNMAYIGYTSAVDKDIIAADEAAAAVLEANGYDLDEFFDDPIRYPAITDKLGVMRDFGANQDAVISMWEDVKAEASQTGTLAIILGSVGGAIVLAVVIYLIVAKTKGRRRIKK